MTISDDALGRKAFNAYGFRTLAEFKAEWGGYIWNKTPSKVSVSPLGGEIYLCALSTEGDDRLGFPLSPADAIAVGKSLVRHGFIAKERDKK